MMKFLHRLFSGELFNEWIEKWLVEADPSWKDPNGIVMLPNDNPSNELIETTRVGGCLISVRNPGVPLITDPTTDTYMVKQEEAECPLFFYEETKTHYLFLGVLGVDDHLAIIRVRRLDNFLLDAIEIPRSLFDSFQTKPFSN